MAQRRGRYSPKLIQDNRGMQAARFTAGMGKALKGTFDTISKQRDDKEKELNKLTKESLTQSQAYLDKIKDFKKTNSPLDEQIIALIEEDARMISDKYMKAYGPDGTPEDMIEYQKLNNQTSRSLDDLTMMIGAIDVDNDARDLAKQENRLIYDKDNNGNIKNNEDEDIFKYGITNGASDIKLSRGPNGFVLSGKAIKDPELGTMTSNITMDVADWSESLRKNGKTFEEKSPNLDLTSVDYGRGLVDKFKDQIEIDVTGEATKKKNPNYLKGGATPSTKNPGYDTSGNAEYYKETKSYTIKDPKKAKEVILNYFNDAGGIVSFDKNKPVPSEKELWAMLQEQGRLDYSLLNRTPEKVKESWSQINPSMMDDAKLLLQRAYADYIVETMSPTGQEETNVTLNKTGAVKLKLD